MGLRTREQRDLVPKLYESVGQVRHDAFGTAIQAGRHRLIQRRDLCDLHKSSLTPNGPVIGLTTRVGCYNRASTYRYARTLGIEPRKPVGAPRMRGLRQSWCRT